MPWALALFRPTSWLIRKPGSKSLFPLSTLYSAAPFAKNPCPASALGMTAFVPYARMTIHTLAESPSSGLLSVHILYVGSTSKAEVTISRMSPESIVAVLMKIPVGVPFHSGHQSPRASCPLCVVERNDHSEKSLFFVNGTSKDEHDSNIPEAYFQTPPLKFISGDVGFEALRVGCLPSDVLPYLTAS